jgi:hypothetical protein
MTFGQMSSNNYGTENKNFEETAILSQKETEKPFPVNKHTTCEGNHWRGIIFKK